MTSPAVCSHCDFPLDPSETVRINGKALHVVQCFRDVLLDLMRRRQEFLIDVEGLSPQRAYDLGRETVDVMQTLRSAP